MYKSELMAFVPAEKQDDAEACIKEMLEGARKMGAEDNGWEAFFRGCLRSWTQRFSAILMAWPVLQPALTPYIDQLLPPAAANWWIAALGAISFMLRMKTTESLEEKGIK